ncbi:MAG: mycofactocin biosynthesis chaperone MftB [Candidatus Dadabacteria bacterium]|nr:MAG: mycofactocin biosynthesis chaperone MftB [Candidatus Dadabacteria bacterium]
MNVRYRLHPCCRVRREAFGLLFYDSRGPKLLFAETEALLDPEDLRAGVGWAELERRLGPRSAERVRGFLERLVAKGFLREQPVC